MRTSKVPGFTNKLRQVPWAVNLENKGFMNSIIRATKAVGSVAIEIVGIARQAYDQGRPQVTEDMLGISMQRIWFALVSIDRAISCHVLASHLDPTFKDKKRKSFSKVKKQLAEVS